MTAPGMMSTSTPSGASTPQRTGPWSPRRPPRRSHHPAGAPGPAPKGSASTRSRSRATEAAQDVPPKGSSPKRRHTPAKTLAIQRVGKPTPTEFVPCRTASRTEQGYPTTQPTPDGEGVRQPIPSARPRLTQSLSSESSRPTPSKRDANHEQRAQTTTPPTRGPGRNRGEAHARSRDGGREAGDGLRRVRHGMEGEGLNGRQWRLVLGNGGVSSKSMEDEIQTTQASRARSADADLQNPSMFGDCGGGGHDRDQPGGSDQHVPEGALPPRDEEEAQSLIKARARSMTRTTRSTSGARIQAKIMASGGHRQQKCMRPHARREVDANKSWPTTYAEMKAEIKELSAKKWSERRLVRPSSNGCRRSHGLRC